MRRYTLLGGVNSSLALRQPRWQCFSQLQSPTGQSKPDSRTVLHRETQDFAGTHILAALRDGC